VLRRPLRPLGSTRLAVRWAVRNSGRVAGSTADRTVQRQIAFFKGRSARAALPAIDVMCRKFDSAVG
jgi:hypothetical protein